MGLIWMSYIRRLAKSRSFITDTFLPLPTRQTMRPSMVQVATTPSTDRAFWSSSDRRIVRFSVITSRVPLSCRFAPKILCRVSYEVNFTMIGRGYPFEVFCEAWPRRWLRSMHSLVRLSPSLSLATDRTALSVSV